MTTIAHITDLHIADPRHDVTLDDGHRLVDAILADDIDVVVDTGDVTGSGTASQYATAREVTERLRDADVDYYVLPGNHDVAWQGSSYARWSRDRWESYAEDVDTSYTAGDEWPRVIDYDDVRLVLADSCAEPTAVARGALGGGQIERIGQAVEEAEGLALLFSHHCPSADAQGKTVALTLTDRDEITRRLEQAGGVDAWLTGHLHQTCEWSSVFGARYLLASDMSTAAGGYRRLWWGEGLRWEWCSVRCN